MVVPSPLIAAMTGLAVLTGELPDAEVRLYEGMSSLALCPLWYGICIPVRCAPSAASRIHASPACPVPICIVDGVLIVEGMSTGAVRGVLGAVVVDPVPGAIEHVVCPGTPAEVRQSIVRRVVIQVSALHALRARADEGFQDEAVHQSDVRLPYLPVERGKGCLHVPAFQGGLLHESGGVGAALAGFHGAGPLLPTYSALVTALVSTVVSGDVFPGLFWLTGRLLVSHCDHVLSVSWRLGPGWC